MKYYLIKDGECRATMYQHDNGLYCYRITRNVKHDTFTEFEFVEAGNEDTSFKCQKAIHESCEFWNRRIN